MNRIKIVAIDTLIKQMKSVSFWAMVFMPVIMGILSLAIGYFVSQGDNTNSLTIVTSDELKPYFENIGEYKFKFEDEKTSQEMMDDHKIDSYALIKEDNGVLNIDYHGSPTDSNKLMALQVVTNRIQQELNQSNANLNNDQINIISKAPVFNFNTEENQDIVVAQVAYFVLIFLMYMVLIAFTSIIVTEIATEKGTKMIEFIFSSIRAGDYFAGKMIGNFIVVLIQLLMYILFGIIGFMIANYMGIFEGLNLNFVITNNTIYMIIEIVLLVLLGIFIYLIVAGMLGSFATKTEDGGKVASPIILVTIFLFYASFILQSKGDMLVTRILSYIPFASTFFMPLRLLNENATLFEGAISIVVLLISIILMYKFGERVYKNNILNYSSDIFFKGFGRKRK